MDESPNVSRARTARQEWFKTTQSNFQNVKLALQAVGTGIYYDFTKLVGHFGSCAPHFRHWKIVREEKYEQENSIFRRNGAQLQPSTERERERCESAKAGRRKQPHARGRTSGMGRVSEWGRARGSLRRCAPGGGRVWAHLLRFGWKPGQTSRGFVACLHGRFR